MKKILFLLAAASLAAAASPLIRGQTLGAKAGEDYVGPSFDEDFESYETTGDSYVEAMRAKWDSGYYTNKGDNNYTACGPDKYKVAEDPAADGAHGKVLYVDTYTTNEDFFYLTPRDVIAKDFRITYDFYQVWNADAPSPWAGWNFRKPEDGRYNGVTNVMMTVRNWEEQSLGVQMYRSVGASFSQETLSGPNGESDALPYNSDRTGFAGATGVWLEVEIEAIGYDFKISINDQALGVAHIEKKMANQYGYLSFVNCLTKCYLDNIHIENLDTEAPPASSSSEATIEPPTVAQSVYDVNLGEDAVVEVELHGEAITSLRQAKNELLAQYYSVDGNELTIFNDYLKKLGTGRWSFVLTTAGGSCGFTLNVIEASAEESSSGETATSSDDGGSGGCGGSIAGTAVVGAVALAGAVLLGVRHRKKQH
jgi:hypothetical protein